MAITTIYGQVGDDGELHPLGKAEITHPELAEKGVVELLREIADEMEAGGRSDLAALEEMYGKGD